jgi:NAD(P)-dependent dehydrogenase (short-subunit alcohol dehydrogenase family)
MTPAVVHPSTAAGPAAGEELRGTTVVMTGVGRPGQVGEVVAAAFARRGVNLVLVDREVSRAQRVAAAAADAGVVAHAFGCDLADPGDVSRLAADAASVAPDGVRALVHLAGGYDGGTPVADLDPAVWHRLFTINLTTAFVTSRAFLPLLRVAQGALVFFASAAALPGASVSRTSAYAAAKGGVITLMRAIAAEERAAGVRANALALQAVRTASNLETMGEKHPYVERELVAEWAWWLCSAASGPVSGQVIRLG